MRLQPLLPLGKLWLSAHFVTSIEAHALITNIDVSAALTAPGVLDIITGNDHDLGFLPGSPPPSIDVVVLGRVYVRPSQNTHHVVVDSDRDTADIILREQFHRFV